MGDDEPDYMSDDFLKSCVAADVRPGLAFSRQQQRNNAMQQQQSRHTERHRAENPPRAAVEAAQRDKGLAQPIDSSNKGFAMMQMMGYKPGTAIGKQGQGRVEPVSVSIKLGRGGLGREEALQAVRRRKQAIRARRQGGATVVSAEQFRRRMRDKMADRYVQADLMKSQRICQQLDETIEVDSPGEPWFWPPAPDPVPAEDAAGASDEQGDDEEEADNECVEEPVFSPMEKLEMLTEYLRRTHCYCIWCGCSHRDDEDLRDNCPGNSRSDHS